MLGMVVVKHKSGKRKENARPDNLIEKAARRLRKSEKPLAEHAASASQSDVDRAMRYFENDRRGFRSGVYPDKDNDK